MAVSWLGAVFGWGRWSRRSIATATRARSRKPRTLAGRWPRRAPCRRGGVIVDAHRRGDDPGDRRVIGLDRERGVGIEACRARIITRGVRALHRGQGFHHLARAFA